MCECPAELAGKELRDPKFPVSHRPVKGLRRLQQSCGAKTAPEAQTLILQIASMPGRRGCLFQCHLSVVESGSEPMLPPYATLSPELLS
jgi:hypothetical protein